MSPFLSTGTPSGLDLCKPCAQCQSLLAQICVSLDSLVSLVSSIVASSCLLFPKKSLIPEEMDFDGDVPFRTECLVILLVGLYICSIYYRRKLLWQWMSKTVIYEYIRLLLGDILLACFFFRTIASGFPLVSGCWPPSSVKHEFHLMAWVSNTSRWFLVALITLCHCCPSAFFRQITIVYHWILGWFGVHLCPLISCRLPSSTINNSQQRWRLLVVESSSQLLCVQWGV